jgi:hypothetical protein
MATSSRSPKPPKPQKSDAQDSIEVGFGESMRELHGNVMQAMNVIHTRAQDRNDAHVLRKLEEVSQLFESYRNTNGEFTDNWLKFSNHIEAYYKRQAKNDDEVFLVTSGEEALAIAASADPIIGVLDPVGMAARGC